MPTLTDDQWREVVEDILANERIKALHLVRAAVPEIGLRESLEMILDRYRRLLGEDQQRFTAIERAEWDEFKRNIIDNAPPPDKRD